MEINHNRKVYHFELQDVADAKVSFSLFHVRRFTLETKEGPVKLSLKDLQKAICKSSNLDADELDFLRKEFRQMREKGYKGSKSYELQKYNVIVRIIAHVFHHFSKKTYNQLMAKLDNVSVVNPLNSDEVFFDKWEKEYNELKTKVDNVSIVNPLDFPLEPSSQEILDKWNRKYDQIVSKHKAAKTNPRDDLKKHRIELYQETKRRAKEGFYVGNQLVNLNPHLTKIMIKEQEVFEVKDLKASPLPNPNYKTEYEFVSEDSLVLAENCIQEGLNPVVLNLANPHNPGGGVETGSPAQEESIFRRTNYHEALYPQKKALYPIDKAKAIYTPFVQVFRTPEKNLYKDNQPDSYQYRDPFAVAMIACAAINLNGKKPPNDFEERTRAKIRLILAIAVDQGHDSIILGALGCGAFKNPPEQISLYFKEALESDEFKGRFKKVSFGILYNDQLLSTFDDRFKN